MTEMAPELFGFEGYTLDVRNGCLCAADREVELRPKSFEVLRYLVENAERLVSKEELIRAIWPNVIVSDESLTHCVSEVRQAIGDDKQRIIRTVPRRGYRFMAVVSRLASNDAPGAKLAPAGTSPSQTEVVDALQRPSLRSRPSIAVLAFANLSGDPQQDYFSDGVTEDIITELSRFSELMVIARNSSFQYKGRAVDIRQVGKELGVRYVLEGSIRRDGNNVRITAQLLDSLTAGHVWAERYDRNLSSVFAIQDEVTRTIVAIIAAHVNKTETERTLLKPAAAWQAYDYYLRGAEAYSVSVRDGGSPCEARSLLEKSLSIDPRYARAYAMLSRTRVRTFWDPVDRDYLDPAGIDRAYELAWKAVQFDASLPLARFQLGMALLFKRRRDEALAEFDQAYALNPNATDYQFGYGLALAGQPAKAMEVLQENLRFDPFGLPARFCYLGQASYMLGHYAHALPPLRQCTLRMPTLWSSHAFLAAAQAQLGNVDEARVAVAKALGIYAGFTVEKINRALPYNSPGDLDHLSEGLRKAGLPV